MNITIKQDGGTLCVAPEGRLDTRTAPQLEKALEGRLDGITDLVFDFRGVEYISSAGLRILLAEQKVMAHKGSMKITKLNEIVQRIFELTGFSDILDIE